MSKDVEQDTGSVPPPRHSSLITHYFPVLLSLAALFLLFYAVLQMDRPAIEWVRSLQGVWIERVGDTGYLLGKGWTLAAISGLFVAAGYARANQAWRLTGFRGWVAHAVVAVLVQGLKHGIGRPRPRLHRDGEFFTGPGLESGLDSFPSGHASASFAVAAVVARYHPALAWPAYALAGFVAATRVFRGSHFVSDALAGVVLGLLVGTLAATPVSDWMAALRRLLLAGTPWLAAACAVAWLIVLPSPDPVTTGLLLGAAALAWLARIAQAGGEGQAARGRNPSPSL